MTTLAFALSRDSRLANLQSAELLASIVAERIDRLEASDYRNARVVSARGAVPSGSPEGPMMLRRPRERQVLQSRKRHEFSQDLELRASPGAHAEDFCVRFAGTPLSFTTYHGQACR
jgi:hypothetical protein